jgi:hypothetical protein
MLLSKALEKPHQPDHSSSGSTVDLAAMFDAKSALLGSLAKGFVVKAMKLLVTMSTLLTPNDYQQLGPHLWNQVRVEEDSSSTASVRFFVEYLEINSLTLLLIIGLFSFNAMRRKDTFGFTCHNGGRSSKVLVSQYINLAKLISLP